MQLTTLPLKPINSQCVPVFWSLGKRSKGLLTIHLPTEYDEPKLIAELCAIRFLLCKAPVLPTNLDGTGIKLNVSTGAIKKLALDVSAKKEAVPYARFLQLRLKNLKYQVTKKNDLLSLYDQENLQKKTLFIQKEDYQTPYEPIPTPCLGPVVITDHSVQRYIERNRSGDIKKPFHSLLKRLSHPKIKQIPIPKRVLQHKTRKYGEQNNIETWGHPTSSLTYLVLNKLNQKILLTVFQRQAI